MIRTSHRPAVGLLGLAVVACLAAVTPVAASPGAAAAAPAAVGGAEVDVEAGYHLVTAEGDVLAFGTADDDGDLVGVPLNGPVVDGAGSGSGEGYWLAASDGGVFAFGDARFLGSAGGLPLNQPIVGMAATASGRGYWLVASDGGVFSYGDARFHGSTGNLTLNSPVTDIEPTPTGEGYWLVAEDGGIFSYGDAAFHGSLGAQPIDSPVVGMAADSDGGGYWLARADGSIAAFGSAPDLPGIGLREPAVAVVRNAVGTGFWLTTRIGEVYAAGDADVVGSNAGGSVAAAAVELATPVVGIFPEASGQFELTVLHNNDGESQLVDAGGDNAEFGGIAAFAAVVERLRDDVLVGNDEGTILLSSGDNFLAGTELAASFAKGVPWYDTIALRRIGYDAMAIGNHEFDFGPERLAQFIEGFEGSVPFLSANLDVSGAPELAALADDGDIAASTVVVVNGRQVGVVGATTPLLASISTPGAVEVDADVAGTVQAEVDELTDAGIGIVILISHLQDVDQDRALIAGLSGVDIAIAGGGDELLANEGDLLLPDDMVDPALPYPLIETDADGELVPVVTTAGNYTYVGRLVATFDADGEVVSIGDESGPVRVVTGTQPDAVEPDPFLLDAVVAPVEEFSADLADNVIATSEVTFENRRGDTFGTEPAGKRTQETNLGNLIADAFVWQAETAVAENPGTYPDITLDDPVVAVQNGGGMREDVIYGPTPPWDVTEKDTFDILPFGNFAVVLQDITAVELKALFESAYESLPDSSGGFLQVSSGLQVSVDLGQPAGSRVRSIVVDADGSATTVVSGGAVTVPSFEVDLVVNSFTAAGGDDLPLPAGSEPFSLGFTGQQVLANYLQDPDGLNGTVTSARYPEVPLGGGTRILITP